MGFFDSMFQKLISWDQIPDVRESLNGKKIVFTNGCFDLLHPGHVSYLAQARDLGDLLWIGVNADESVRRLKGSSRPLHSVEDRSLVLSSLACVDFVSVFAEDTPIAILSRIQPSIHCKGGDYNVEALPETPLLRSMGCEIVILPFVAGKSTTLLLEKAKTSS